MIPVGWKSVRFAEIASYKAGRTPSRARSDYWKSANDAIPWVAISDMKEFGIVTAPKERITKDAFEQVFRGCKVPAGTLIMSFKLTIGRVATLGIDACHNEAIIAIYPKPDVDQRFLSYAMSQVDYDTLQDRQVKGNTLNQEKIDRIEISLPPLKEQVAIAEVLDLLRHAIQTQEDALVVAQDLKQAAMRELFARGLRGEAVKETGIGSIPESWELRTLAEVSNIERGRFLHRPRNEPRFYGGSTPFVQTGDVVRSQGRIQEFSQTLNAAGVAISRVFPAGTILITIAANIGYTGILQFHSACPDSLVAIAPRKEVSVEFLEYWLQTQQPDMDRAAPKGTQKNINLQFLLPWPVPVPSIAEQREIVAVLDPIDRKMDLSRRKRVVLDDLFRALLQKLMTGEIRVSDLDLSVLSTDTATGQTA